jgi:hypothetical protein
VNDDMLTPQSLFIEPPRRDRITAISSVVQSRPIVLVLGMHRSGTSLCSHLLSALGIDMSDKIPGPGSTSPSPHPSNPWGHWERWEIVEFHDRILGLFNRGYFGRFHEFALPVAWWADPRVVQIRHEIVAFLGERMGGSYFGFKDPRTVRLLPLWHQIFNELRLTPKVVLCLRNPAQVARSLNARDGLDPEIGEYRWLVHMIDFFRYASKIDFCTVEYEEWFSNPSANIQKLQKFLDLPWQQSNADLALLLSGIIDPAARHDDPDHREAGQPLVRSLYKLAGRADQDGAPEQIDLIGSQFVSFQQLQRPFVRAFEEVAGIAAKVPELEQEAARWRSALGERDAIIEAAERKASDAEAGLAGAAANLEAQRAQIAELAGERDARAEVEREATALRATLAERETALASERDARADLECEATALRATLAERETALAELSRRADELLAAHQVAQTELAAREVALLSAERTERERAAAAEAMQADMAALRGALARAEREAQQRSAPEAGLRSEVGSLRETQAKTEREVQERTAAATAAQAEISALQEALAAARQVGKVAIDALRIATVAPARPSGWRRAVVRLVGA